jgi:uncharacterized membrane protein HdeD (DUF308 family)
VASTLFGVYLLLSGFAGAAMAFTLPESAGMRVMLFISGVLSVILAVLCFRNFGNPYPVLLLAIWIGVSFVVQGFSIVAVAISYQALPARGGYGVLGVLSVIAGAVVLVWPWDSIAVLTLATGVWLVAMGIVEIAAHRRITVQHTASRSGRQRRDVLQARTGRRSALQRTHERRPPAPAELARAAPGQGTRRGQLGIVAYS